MELEHEDGPGPLRPLGDGERLDCERAAEFVHLLSGGDLEPAEQRAVERHVAGCDACRGALEVARELRQVYFETAARATSREPAIDLWPGVRRGLVAGGLLPGEAAPAAGPAAGPSVAPEAAPHVASDGGPPVAPAAGRVAAPVYRGRFGLVAGGLAAAALALVGAQLLFGPGTPTGAELAVTDGTTAARAIGAGAGDVDINPSAANAGAAQAADLMAETAAPAGLHPIGLDQRLIQPGAAAASLAPVEGFPLRLVPTTGESLASYR